MLSILADTFTVAARQTAWSDERYAPRAGAVARGWEAERDAAVARLAARATPRPE